MTFGLQEQQMADGFITIEAIAVFDARSVPLGHVRNV
jgi:hypothetical protein